MTLEQALERILTNPAFLVTWGVLVLGSLRYRWFPLMLTWPSCPSLMGVLSVQAT
jgi:hypothetical protein